VISSPTAISGTAEAIVDGETGLLVPPADTKSLACAIRSLLADPVSARRLAVAAKARVREFSAETMVQRIMQVYDELTQRLEANSSHRDLGSRAAHPWRMS
jgi:glycosyltransferase involved in cell wall biosynthesis